MVGQPEGTTVMYEFQGFTISDDMMDGLQRYIRHGVQPGQFLMAVLSNDLKEACARADLGNMRNLPAYVAYLYNKAPAPCWGSPEKVLAWLARFARNA